MFFLFRSKPRTQGGRGHLHRTTSSVLVAVQWLSQPLPLGRGSFLLSWASENIEGDWKKRSNHMFCCCFVRLRSDFVFWIVVIITESCFLGSSIDETLWHGTICMLSQKHDWFRNTIGCQTFFVISWTLCLMDYDSYGLLESSPNCLP